MVKVFIHEARLMPRRVLDTHVHLAGNELPNSWLPGEPAAFQREWTEAKLIAANGPDFEVEGYVFVECSNSPAIAEAKWVLDMVEDSGSKIVAAIANIPVPDGAAAVNSWLDQLRNDSGNLPVGLKGGRVVLLGDPMPLPTACLDPTYLDGLQAIGEAGLLWEWCCLPEAIPSISTVVRKFPKMSFVLDHLGHNSGGEDFETWAPAIESLAKLPNVVAKLGAIEQWDVADPGKFLDHALNVFGADRVMAESNWFVNEAMGKTYDDSFNMVAAACERAGYSEAQIDAVFCGNAKRVYSLE